MAAVATISSDASSRVARCQWLNASHRWPPPTTFTTRRTAAVWSWSMRIARRSHRHVRDRHMRRAAAS